VTKNRERVALFGIWGLAALACILGWAAPPSSDPDPGHGQQVLDLIRIVTTTGLAITMLLGPGLLWRAGAGPHRPSLGFLPLPGLALLAATGGLAWALAANVEPRIVCLAVTAPLLGLLLGGLLGAGPENLLEHEEQWALLIVACALGMAIGRALWSLGPEGELYAGGISRTLEVGDRSDSRISFHVVQLVAHGTKPFSTIGSGYFAPYNFSSRGPLPGLASAPIVLLAGGKPPISMPEMPWRPFDPQGFMAYRIAMMTFGCSAFLALWQLTRRLGGTGAGRLAVLLAATTPFLVHEIWFTWPKMLAAAFVLLAGLLLVERRPLGGGLLVGAGYLMHPGTLLSLSALGLIALWPLRGANWRRPQLKSLAMLMAGVAGSVLLWRLVNGSHFTQSGFVEYLTEAGFNMHPSPRAWLEFRGASLVNTTIPLVPFFFFSHNMAVNVVGGTSPAAIHFFFQYWNTLPFGVGILFFPLLLIALWRAGRLWPWPVIPVVAVPFVAFAIYWGSSLTGLLREGLQAWVLVLFAVVALQQQRVGFPWLRSKPIRAILALRSAEILLIAIGPALATNGFQLLSDQRTLNDAAAFALMLICLLGMAAAVWRTTAAPLAGKS
jgi:hypothetical protein